MATILKPCRVPWDVSPTMSGVTLIHTETGTAPECAVVFGGNRLLPNGEIGSTRVEVTFQAAWHARLGPKSDNDDITSAGFQVFSEYDGPIDRYLEWRGDVWRERGTCPDASFYVAVHSDWLASLPREASNSSGHYLVEGRDGNVEIIAEGFAWREWMWLSGERDVHIDDNEVVGRGSGID